MNLEVEIIKDKFISDIFCVKNIKFDISDSPNFKGLDLPAEINYPGNYFIFSLDSFLYFHTLHEGIGQYEILKNIIEDLKIVAICADINLINQKNVLSVYLDLLKPYNIDYDDIIFLEKENPIFENIFYYTTRINPLLEKLKIPQGKEIYQPTDFYMEGFKALRGLYDSSLVGDSHHPKKIFITRMNQNNRVRKIYKMIYDFDITGSQLPPELEQERQNMGGQRYLLQLLNERYITKEEEEKLEQFFIDKGYTVIDPETMSFYDQINYYYNATHIATIRGSGLLNTLFCQPETNVFILDTCQPYEFEYKKICQLYTDNVYEVPFNMKFKKFMPQSLFSIDNIIGIIESHYSEII